MMEELDFSDTSDAADTAVGPLRVMPSAIVMVDEEFADLTNAKTLGDESEEITPGAHESPYIVSPVDGECAQVNDADALIDLLERIDATDKKVYACKVAIREALAKLTEGDAKTRRVQGQRRKAVIEMPADSWDNSILKEAWNSFPALAGKYLRIEKIAVQLREYKKMVNTSGPVDFTAFRDMVTKANRGPTGTPTVKIEV